MQKANLKLNDYDWRVYLRDEADQSVFNEIFKLKEYRAADDAVKNAKYPIVDAGAHAGFFAMHARALNKKIKIFAVEPEPENLKLLERHLAENKISGVKIIAAALAGETGKRRLLISSDSHNHRLMGKDETSEKTIPVKTFSFSDFCRQNKIKKVSLLKMDIEGGEREVLGGMSDHDFAMVKSVILEYHNKEHKSIEGKLRVSGFGAQIFPSRFDKTMGFVFANNKRFKS